MKKSIITLFISSTLILFLNACLEEQDPNKAPVHSKEWTNAESQNFHGLALSTQSLNLESCTSCHGSDYKGGTSQVSCMDAGCHAIYPHPEGFKDPTSANFHENIMSVINWDLASCQACHGTDYAGNGNDEKNCLTCHTESGGPEACNTCHGGQVNAGPPKDLMNRSETRFKSVGAHQAHLTGDTWSTVYLGDCSVCHQVPNAFSDAGHIDDSPHAEVIFSSLSPDGVWDGFNGTCNNTYCHGNFQFNNVEGNNKSMFWTGVGVGQAACGSCHNLPPKGHPIVQPNACVECHGSVVDENLNIVNKGLHINGAVNF